MIAAAPQRRHGRAGLLFALAGFVLLSTGDAVAKTMSGEWPPTAVAALRYTIGAVGLAGLLGAREVRAGFALPAWPIQLLRGFWVAMATVGFFAAIFLMPLATATAITFTSPIITALLAPFVLGERLARGGLMALGLAFAGTVVVLRPSLDALGWQALLPLMSALGMSLLIVGNRLMAGRASTLAMQFGVAGGGGGTAGRRGDFRSRQRDCTARGVMAGVERRPALRHDRGYGLDSALADLPRHRA